MNLSRIQYFLKVAELGSISKACSHVFLSQPALTLQIQALEEELGMKLFERHNRGLTLTSSGELLYQRAATLINWQQETLEELNREKLPKGTIRIGTYTTASSYLLPEMLKEFFKSFPEINIEYDYSSVEESINKLKRLEADCLIMSEVPEVEGLKKIPLRSDKLVLVASSRNKKVPAKITPKELENYAFLKYPHKFDYCYREVERKLGKYLAKAPTPVTSESFDTLKQSLLADLGISFMPKYLIEKELQDKTLRTIELSGISLPIQFYLVVKEEDRLSRRVEVLRDFAKAHFSGI